jgi:hypothetical protein
MDFIRAREFGINLDELGSIIQPLCFPGSRPPKLNGETSLGSIAQPYVFLRVFLFCRQVEILMVVSGNRRIDFLDFNVQL